MMLTGRRRYFPGSVAIALVVAALAVRNGDVRFAVFAMLWFPAFGAWQAFARSETAVINTSEADERQRAIATEAVRHAYGAVVAVAVLGLLWEVARGEPGAFAIVASVGGFTHLAATALLRRRR